MNRHQYAAIGLVLALVLSGCAAPTVSNPSPAQSGGPTTTTPTNATTSNASGWPERVAENATTISDAVAAVFPWGVSNNSRSDCPVVYTDGEAASVVVGVWNITLNCAVRTTSASEAHELVFVGNASTWANETEAVRNQSTPTLTARYVYAALWVRAATETDLPVTGNRTRKEMQASTTLYTVGFELGDRAWNRTTTR